MFIVNAAGPACLLSTEEQAESVYQDCSKAFDTVTHSVLVSRFRYYGPDGWAAGWGTMWLDGQSYQVAINGLYVAWKVLTWSTKWLVLRPVLFNIFISCLKEETECVLIRFADDIKLEKTVDMLKSRAVSHKDQDR